MAEDKAGSKNEEDLWAAAAEDLEEQRQILRDSADKSAAEKDEEAVAVAKDAAPEASAETADEKLGMVLDIPLNLSVELGSTKMLINDLLQLGQGSVIELTKLVGDPLEVMVNKKLIAKGEVVVVNEKFGVRITEVIGPKERIESLG
ncbi:MAG: flagellar motor switch protein FliN [Nitrospinota bacterium]